MNENKRKYAWSRKIDDEIWRGGPCDSIDECIQEAIDEGYVEGDKIAVGLTVNYEVDFVDCDILLERLAEEAYDRVGVVADDWLSCTSREEMEELENAVLNVIKDWMKKHGHEPTFYKIEPLKYVTIGCGAG